MGQYSKNVVQGFLQAGVTIDNGYSVYTMRFATDGKTSSATVTIPYDPGLQPPAGGYHIVANNHGSFGIDDPCALAGTNEGIGLSGYFGARGLIGVTVDYPGMGTSGVHTYLGLREEGASVLDGLRATVALAKELEAPTSGRFALAGLSQGGHATLAAATLHTTYAPELNIRAFAAAGPATAWEKHWSEGVAYAGSHIVYHAMLMYAWVVNEPEWAGLSLWHSSIAATIGSTLTGSCLWSTPSLFDQIPWSAESVFDPSFLQAYRTRSWGAYAAVSRTFSKNAIAPYTQTAPLRIYQGDRDTTTPLYATREMVDALRAGGVTVDFQIVPGADHLDIAFGYLAYYQRRTEDAIAWLGDRLAS